MRSIDDMPFTTPTTFSTIDHMRSLAAYNGWANLRLYGDAATLAPDDVHRDIGLYFGGLFGTLVHILQTDRAWMHLLRGGDLADLPRFTQPTGLSELADLRRRCDGELIAWIGSLTAEDLGRPFTFVSGLKTWQGMRYEGVLGGALIHVFNHQTHHRGQAHAALTILGLSEPRALDILVQAFQ